MKKTLKNALSMPEKETFPILISKPFVPLPSPLGLAHIDSSMPSSKQSETSSASEHMSKPKRRKQDHSTSDAKSTSTGAETAHGEDGRHPSPSSTLKEYEVPEPAQELHSTIHDEADRAAVQRELADVAPDADDEIKQFIASVSSETLRAVRPITAISNSVSHPFTMSINDVYEDKRSRRQLIDVICTDPMDLFFNPCRLKTQDLSVNKAQGQDVIRTKDPTAPSYVKFYLVGLLTDFKVDTDAGSAFQIAPVHQMWSRLVALLGAMFDTRALYFSSYQKGITFSTKRYKNKPRTSDRPKPIIEVADKLVLDYDDEVPIYDARDDYPPFVFEDLPLLDKDDLLKNSVVLVTFHVTRYESKQKALPPACSMNIKELVLLNSAEKSQRVTSSEIIFDANLNFKGLPSLSTFGDVDRSLTESQQKAIKSKEDEAKDRIRALKRKK